MIAFTELVQGIDLLAPPPAVAGRLARIARDQRTGISEVVTVVRYDATLTGGLLAYANGAAESAGGSIADLQDAIARLGVPKILTLAVMSHAAPMMMAALPAYGLSEGEVWRHALASAHAVEILQRHTPARIAPA
ncbi:MAG: HDOD domain-containing protein, partial [Candidatus Eisenbacteria bacterium]